MSKKPYGVLLLHGFTATRDCIRPVEPSLKALGLPIRVPLLRGHEAKSPEALFGVTWHDWLADAESALEDLMIEVEQVIIVGISMGGAVTLLLAAKHGTKLDSIVCIAASVELRSPLAPGKPFHFVAPFLGLIRKRMEFAPRTDGLFQGNYDWAPMKSVLSCLDLAKTVRKQLSKIQTPTLLIQSRIDSTVAPKNMDVLYHGISTTAEQKHIVWFEKSAHDMLRDLEKDAIIDVIVKYIQKRIGIIETAESIK